MASARRYQDLKAWQHAAQLREGVMAITARSPLSNDRHICDQLRRAAQSACANLAEGFGRYGPREFAHFVGIARSSLDEVQEHLRYCELAGQISGEEAQRLILLAREGAATCTGLMRYLKSPAALQNAGLRVRNQKNQDPTQS
jgi:four helix bundle protein